MKPLPDTVVQVGEERSVPQMRDLGACCASTWSDDSFLLGDNQW
jgi:hypothetical protein